MFFLLGFGTTVEDLKQAGTVLWLRICLMRLVKMEASGAVQCLSVTDDMDQSQLPS